MKRYIFIILLLLLSSLFVTACSTNVPVVQVTPTINALGQPSITMSLLTAGTQLNAGEQVSVQATISDPTGIKRVELVVDSKVVATQGIQTPQTLVITTLNWTAIGGAHAISVRAFNTANIASEAATIQVAALPMSTPAAAPTLAPATTFSPTATRTATATALPKATSAPTDTPVPPTATPAPPTATGSTPATCADNSALVADVTVTDPTTLRPGEAFVKTWRLRNDGTCTWGNGYTLSFINGESMTPDIQIGVPATALGATVDLSVPMTAPLKTGIHTGFWQMRNPRNALFGIVVLVRIRVEGEPSPGPSLTPTATITPGASACTGTPNFASFSASPTTIDAGQSATLNWGLVSNADRAEIDNSIGGVATPGSIAVSPRTTTTYTLTAFCGTTTRTDEVTINVR